MKRFLSCILLASVCGYWLTATAQTQDATTVYSEFARNFTIISSSSPSSAEYLQATQTMLQLFPQLQYHAAWYSQHGSQANALTFAKAYVDMAMMPQFEDMHLEKSEAYPTMTNFVASYYYNRKDYNNAATYIERYIDIGATKNRALMFVYLSKCYEHIGDQQKQLQIIDKGLEEFPNDQNLLSLAIDARIAEGYYDEALAYIERSLAYKPNDKNRLSLKGQCLEGLQRYEEAVGIYALLSEQNKTLNNYKHYAINLYDCAVLYYPTNKERGLSYFLQAIPILRQVVANDPTSVQFTHALAMAYLYTDQYELLDETNARLRAMGAAEVGAAEVPQLTAISSDLQRPAKNKQETAANRLTTPTQTTPTPAKTTQPAKSNKSQTDKSNDFKAFAQNYIEKEIQLWQQKDPFETISEYKERVTEETRNQKVEELMADAKKEYISRNSKKVRISDFQLQPYDAENRVFLIQSNYGDIILPVPRENDEARNFANGWKTVTVENAQYDIAGDEMVIRSIDFVTRTGIVYHYSDTDERKYSQTEVNMQFDNINYAELGNDNNTQKKNVKVEKQAVTVGNSDVDINIPVSKSVHNNRFAFLVGNENYQQLAAVPFALRDVQVMKQYCNKTLGIPETNIRLYENATFGKMLSCIRDIKNIAQAYNGDIDIIFYYAGHGMPDESSKSAYLLPIDADGMQTETCYSVGRLYQELGQLGINSIIVFMDACFSGSQRGEGMLASARGVALKPKPDTPQGKMVTLSAATGEETAFPYEAQQHGMFTYYLLKYLQETKGKTTLGELADYVTTNVRQRSVVVNNKSQTPTVNASFEAVDWRKWNLK